MTQQQLKSKAFPKGGFYVMRDGDLYMIIDCVPTDPKSPSGHKHNSRLSFELFAGDKSFIIDPGTYVYTADKEMRNLFRSTKYHNTVVVDGEEQNRFDEDRLFAMNLDVAVKVNRWLITENYDCLDAEHNGYSRLNVIHRRQIYFNKKEGYWEITDFLTGEGEQHKVEWYYHFAPMKLEQDPEKPLIVRTKCKGTNIEVVPTKVPEGLYCKVQEGWVSYGYGRKEKAPIVRYDFNGKVPIEFQIKIEPKREEHEI